MGDKKNIKNITETNPPSLKSFGEIGEVPFWQPSLLMFSRMSSWIIGPVVLGIFLGKWLDRRYDTEPWLFLGTVGLAFIISMIGLVKDAFKEMDRLSKEDNNKKE